MKAHIIGLAVVTVILLLAGCAPTVDKPGSSGADEETAGFWKGLWHGFIMLFTFVVSLFRDRIGIYEANNNGNWYNLGFVLGVMIFFGSGGGACRKGR